MAREFWRRFRSDARHAQLLALAALLALNFLAIDFGATPLNGAFAIAGCLAMQAVAARRVGIGFDARSPLISAFSLTLLLRAPSPLWFALAGVLAIGSKFILRLDGKPVFNPAGFAIVLLLVSGAPVWISPGQWGAEAWFAALTVGLACLVLPNVRRTDIAIDFLVAHAALLGARALWLGDPVAVPLHQMESGSLLIFAFFMISDPMTSPSSRWGRLMFAVGVAVLALISPSSTKRGRRSIWL